MDLIHVAIIEDDAVTREAWKSVINFEKGMNCSWAYDSVESALEHLPRFPYVHLLLMDIQLPGKSGIEGVSIFRELIPSMEIVMLTVSRNEKELLEAILAGAQSYFVKEHISNTSELLEGIREILVLKGSVMSTKMARKAFDYLRDHNKNQKKIDGIIYFDELTGAENRALRLLARGYTNISIAEKMNVSKDRIKQHVKRIYQVLEVTNRVQATNKAYGR